MFVSNSMLVALLFHKFCFILY